MKERSMINWLFGPLDRWLDRRTDRQLDIIEIVCIFGKNAAIGFAVFWILISLIDKFNDYGKRIEVLEQKVQQLESK
jgi:hypothetical protein